LSNTIEYSTFETNSSIGSELEGGVLTLSIGNKGAAKLWDAELVEHLAANIGLADGDERVRVLILQGGGSDFCTGFEAMFDNAEQTPARVRLRNAMETIQQLRSRTIKLLSKPVIAMVRGRCTDVGLRVLEGCDIVFAEQGAEFCFNQSELKLLSLSPGGELGPLCMGARARSYYSIYEGVMSAEQAANSGLITFCTSPNAIVQEVQSLARSMCEKDPLALKFTKETLAHVGSMSWDASVSFTAAKFAELKALQAESPNGATRAAAVASFLAGKSKPGLGQ